jgi:hypothetical protein
MKKIFTLISFAAVLAAISCTKEGSELVTRGIGRLTIDMGLEGNTRAVTDEELRNNALVNIYKANFDGLVRSYRYSAMPSTLYLVSDSYRVDVAAGECVKENPDSASWDSKSYKGSAPFTVVTGQNQAVRVEAKLNNAVSQISFDQTVAENFNPGYTFTINVDGNENKQLVYDASNSGSNGYFIIAGLFEPSFNWTFTGTLKKDGSTFTKTGTIANIEQGKAYKMNLKYTIKDGDISFTLFVDYDTEIKDDTIIFEPVSTGLAASSPFEIWAKRATVHADVDASESEGKSIQFSYSSNGSNWTTVDGVNDSEGTWKAELTGLVPSTQYSYRLLIDGTQVGDELTFTTEAAPAIPNGSFEYTSKVTGQSFDKFYDPSCGVEEGMYKFWASGNGDEQMDGSASMSTVITVVDTNEKYDGKQSVCAQSQNAAGIGMLAAGNLFTGQFAGLVGTEGGKVNFGRPWTSRPAAMTLYCKYTTDKMNLIKNHPDGMTLTSDMYDRAQIKVAIGTWNYKTYKGDPDSPVQVNTTDKSTFVDFYTDGSTIANGDLIIYNDGYSVNNGSKVNATTSGWIKYTIPLDYRNLNAYPTHIIVSCASSQFGDYFSGCSSSKLWIDKVELVYE